MSNKQTTFTIKRWQFKHTLLSLVACIVLAFVCLLLGPDGFVSPSTMLSVDERPLFVLRLQRTLLGCLVGASLAAVGAALQCILKNPLADPYIIGVSGGAALGGARTSDGAAGRGRLPADLARGLSVHDGRQRLLASGAQPTCGAAAARNGGGQRDCAHVRRCAAGLPRLRRDGSRQGSPRGQRKVPGGRSRPERGPGELP